MITTGSIVKIIILLGAPGAGKGTVADYLKENYNVVHFSTGNLLRDEIAKGTDTGKEVDSIMKSGGLVNDETVNKIVKSNLSQTLSTGCVVILDGYPRTVDQAKFLDSIVESGSIRAIEIDIDPEVVISRITKRVVCNKCKSPFNTDSLTKDGVLNKICPHCGGDLIKRADDEEFVVRNRLEKYTKETLPVSGYYNGTSRLVKVPGDKTPEEVEKSVSDAFSSFGIEKK